MINGVGTRSRGEGLRNRILHLRYSAAVWWRVEMEQGTNGFAAAGLLQLGLPYAAVAGAPSSVAGPS